MKFFDKVSKESNPMLVKDQQTHKLEDSPIFVGLEDLLLTPPPPHCKLGINVNVLVANKMKVSLCDGSYS
jgi:hypothetical protein